MHQSLPGSTKPIHSKSYAMPLVAAGVTWGCKAQTLNLHRRKCMTQWWNRWIRKRMVPTAVTEVEVILKIFQVEMSTPRHLPARVLLVDEVAVQICQRTA